MGQLLPDSNLTFVHNYFERERERREKRERGGRGNMYNHVTKNSERKHFSINGFKIEYSCCQVYQRR